MPGVWKLLLINRAETISRTTYSLGLREKCSYFHPTSLAEANALLHLAWQLPAALTARQHHFQLTQMPYSNKHSRLKNKFITS